MDWKLWLHRVAFLLAVLWALGDALAQGPVVTRGGALLKREYQTYGALTLYVDGTLGSDSSSCTASGTSACRTIQAAINRVPKVIRHPVVVNIAAGTYAESPKVQGFNVADTPTTSGSLTLTGNWKNATLTTGSATGTFTGAVGGSDTDLGTLTDLTQTWTTNNLRGKAVVVTSGARTGNSWFITSNTATTLRLHNGTTSIASGDTYAIQVPDVVVTGSLTFSGNTGGVASGLGYFTIDKMEFSNTATTLILSGPNVGKPYILRRSRFINSSTSLTVSCIDTGFSGSTTGGVYIEGAGILLTDNLCYPTINGVLYSSGTTNAIFTSFGVKSAGQTILQRVSILAPSSITAAVISYSDINIQSTGTFGPVLISTGASSTCLSVGSATSAHVYLLRLEGCTTGISLSSGAKMDVLLINPAFSSVTNEYQLDGVNYNTADITSFSPHKVSNAWGTLVSLP